MYFRSNEKFLGIEVRDLSQEKLNDILQNNAKYTLAFDGRYFQREEIEPGTMDQYYLGFYLTPGALISAHPTATTNNFAIVQSTNSIRRRDGTQWIDTGSSVNVSPPQKLLVTVNGQTTFGLTFPVVLPGSSSRLYVNGQKADYGTQYLFVDENTLVWQNVGYTLATSDKLEFYYI